MTMISTWAAGVDYAIETDATNQFRRGCRWQWNPYNYTPKQAAAHVALGQTWGRYARTAVATRTLPPGWQLQPIIGHDRWFVRDADGRPASWPTYGGTVLDLSLPAAQRYQADWLYELGQQSGCDWIALDEGVARDGNPVWDAGLHAAAAGAVPTPIGLPAALDGQIAMLALYHAMPDHRPLLWNVACHPDTIAADWARIIPLVEGIMDETGLGRLGTGEVRKQRVVNKLVAYRAALAAGRTVLVTTWGDVTERAGRCLSALGCLADDPGGASMLFAAEFNGRGRVYIVRPWHTWRERLGAPTGPARWAGSICLRTFRTPRGWINSVWIDFNPADPTALAEIGGKTE